MNRFKSIIVVGKELKEIFRDFRSIRIISLAPIIVGMFVGCYILGNLNKDTYVSSLGNILFIIPAFAITSIVSIGLSITVGEKERGTIETTLMLCNSHRELILGKYLSILLLIIFSFVLLLACAVFVYAIKICFNLEYIAADFELEKIYIFSSAKCNGIQFVLFSAHSFDWVLV